MKWKLFLSCLLAISLIYQANAQRIDADSVIRAVVQEIQNSRPSSQDEIYTFQDYELNFFLRDIATNIPLKENGYGIYLFGLFGDDLERFLLLYDSEGYKIYAQRLNTDMLGEILAYLERNKFSPEKSFRYIKGLYNAQLEIESVGEPLIDY